MPKWRFAFVSNGVKTLGVAAKVIDIQVNKWQLVPVMPIPTKGVGRSTRSLLPQRFSVVIVP